MHEPMLAVVGPTGSGKTAAALALAQTLNAEIVSVDSMLVYRGMDVGTAKPTSDERARVAHHMIDVADPSERFTVARYQELAQTAVAGIALRGRRPLLAGGTGLYFRAVVDGLSFPGEDVEARRALEREAQTVGAARLHDRLTWLDPEAAAKIGPGNARRTVRALEVAAATGVRFSAFSTELERYEPHVVTAAGIALAPDALERRLKARWLAMLDGGWLDEVRGLMERGYGGWLTSTQAIGYTELARYLEGRLTLAEAAEQTLKRTKNLARRQRAWFRRDPRIRWFETGEGGAIDVVDDLRVYLVGA